MRLNRKDGTPAGVKYTGENLSEIMKLAGANGVHLGKDKSALLSMDGHTIITVPLDRWLVMDGYLRVFTQTDFDALYEAQHPGLFDFAVQAAKSHAETLRKGPTLVPKEFGGMMRATQETK